MKAILRELSAIFIRYSGLPLIIRNTYARNRVAIILYHNPKPRDLEKHLAYLAKRYTFITLDLLVDAIRAQDWTKIPAKSLVVTFDDGHRRNSKLLPIFIRYNVVPTIYLVTRVVATNRHFWFKHINTSYEYIEYPQDRRLAMLEEHYGFIPTAEYPIDERHALNADEISAMQNHVDFGSHTCFHPVLTTCTDEESSKEISDSKRDIENLVQRQCRHFSYPNGDYGDRELALVESAGYSSARTIDVGWNDRKTDPYRLRITGVSDNASINILAAQLSGVPMFVRYLFAGSITGKHRTVRPRTQSYRRSEKDS